MKKWVFSDDAWRRQLRELERRLTKSDLKRNPNQILLPHTITLEVKYNKNTQYRKNVVWILRTNQKSRFWSYFQGIWHRTDRFQAVTQVEGPLHQMSWPVQIKEVFDVLQSSPDSILDPTDPEIKMHLLEPGEFSVLDMTADQETRSYTEKLWLANLGTSVPL